MPDVKTTITVSRTSIYAYCLVCCIDQHGGKKEEEPVHIINIALQIEKNCKDVEILRKMVYEFTQSKVTYSMLYSQELSTLRFLTLSLFCGDEMIVVEQ